MPNAGRTRRRGAACRGVGIVRGVAGPLPTDASDVTQYLRRWRNGDREALELLLPLVYDHLLMLARARLRSERADDTLDTRALVHEAYLRVAEGDGADWKDRTHFFAVASTAMRRVLIDRARQRRSRKRGGDRARVRLDVVRLAGRLPAADANPDALLALDDALTKLERLHPRQAKAVELCYFASLTLEEAARVLATSAPTVMRDLRFAEAWLARELSST